MKKNYEDEAIFIIVTILLVTLFIITISFNSLKYYKYKVLIGTVIDNDKVKFVLNDKDTKLLQRTNYLYLSGKLKKYKKLVTTRGILNKDNKNYNELIIRLTISEKNIKDGFVNISVLEQKESVFILFKNIWKEK